MKRRNKPVAYIFVKKGAPSTTYITRHIDQHFDILTRYLVIKFIYVTRSNVEAIRRKKIRKTPTMLCERRLYEGVDSILSAIAVDKNVSEPVSTPDSTMEAWYKGILNEGDEVSQDRSDRTHEVQSKMARLEHRRKQREAQNPNISSDTKYSTDTGDSDFLRDAGMDEFDETDKLDNFGNDGNLLLEEYYLEDAKRMGKVVPKNIRRRR